MLFDKQTGVLHLYRGIVIRPGITKNDFRATDEGRTANACAPNSLCPLSGTMFNRILNVRLIFPPPDEKLTAVHLRFQDSDIWSQEVERRGKLFHDSLLREELGEPSITRAVNYFPGKNDESNRFVQYDFPWGTVMSVFDGRSDASSILVKYLI